MVSLLHKLSPDVGKDGAFPRVKALGEQVATEFDGNRNNSDYSLWVRLAAFHCCGKLTKNENKLKSFKSLPKEVLESQSVPIPFTKLSIILCNFSVFYYWKEFRTCRTATPITCTTSINLL